MGASKREPPHLLRGPVFEKPQRPSHENKKTRVRDKESARPVVVRKRPIRQGQVARIWLEGPADKTKRQRDVTPGRDLNRSRCSNGPPRGQSWLCESSSHQSAKQFGRARHQSRLSAMPVDTVWHCIGHSSGVRRLLPTYIQRPKNEKGKQLEALMEASGHFPLRVAEIVRQRTTAWPYLQWPSTAPRFKFNWLNEKPVFRRDR